ncbi:hypothetical protein N2152v2_008502 [Parachlorella kessleri]
MGARLFNTLPAVIITVLAFALLVSGDNVTWQVPLKDNTKKIGPTGKMNITWTGTHGVYEIPSSSCPSAFAPGNGQTELVKPQDGGNYVWQPPADAKAGSKYYLTDQVDDNCKKGLLLTVTIK